MAGTFLLQKGRYFVGKGQKVRGVKGGSFGLKGPTGGSVAGQAACLVNSWT